MLGERLLPPLKPNNLEKAYGDLFLHESLDEEAVRDIVSASQDAVESINNRRSSDMLVSRKDNLGRLLDVLVERRTNLTQQEINQYIGASVEPLDSERLSIIYQLEALPVVANRSALEHALSSIMSEVNLAEMDILPKHSDCRSLLVNEKHEPVEEYGPSRGCFDRGELLSSIPFMKFDPNTCELFFWENILFGTTRVAAFKREDIGVREMIKTSHNFGGSPAKRMKAVRHEERPGYTLEKTIEQNKKTLDPNDAGLTKFTTNIVVPTSGGYIQRHYEASVDQEGAILGQTFQFKRYNEHGDKPQEVEAILIQDTDDTLELRVEAGSSFKLEQKFEQ